MEVIEKATTVKGMIGRSFLRTNLLLVVPRLGGVESLIIRPAITTNAGPSASDRLESGTSDGLVCLSVSLKATDDFIEDLEQTLAA